jgi:hypothetical protein
MEVVVELDVTWIAAARSQRGKFRMIAFKAADISRKTGGPSASHKVCVTLRAACVARSGQPNRSTMIGMAGSAGGGERLRRVMQWAVMASDTLEVDDFLIVKTQVEQVAGGALLRKNFMGGGQASGGINAAIVANAIPR